MYGKPGVKCDKGKLGHIWVEWEPELTNGGQNDLSWSSLTLPDGAGCLYSCTYSVRISNFQFPQFWKVTFIQTLYAREGSVIQIK